MAIVTARFTPGPWDVDETERPLHVHTAYVAHNGTLDICSIGPQAEDTLPNARLIAAAPDLYEALVQWQSMWRDDSPEEFRRMKALTHAALAKADGR